jgi:NAD(P)-dependent dehydrogenase (short-subunit alcohol dehydrogenase family)
VAPGPVWTPLNPADRDADAVSKFGSETPMKRPARPEEIAPAFVFLAAPSCSSYITDEILPIIGRYGAAVAQAVVDLGEKGCRPPARTTGR